MRLRPLLILSLAQALGNAGLSLVILTGGLIGAELAPTAALATLPTSLHILGVALAVIPASLVMRRFGRRAGFVGGAVLAALAGFIATDAIINRNFTLVCVAMLLTGVNGAFIQQYRFAASEYALPQHAGRAVAVVLVGGILSGFLGPELARHAGEVIAPSAYAGAFLGLAACYGLSAALLAGLDDSPTLIADGAGPARPLRVIVAQPLAMIAVLAGAIGYGVMGLMMTATPLQLTHNSGYGLDQSAWVIQSHFLAMFAPSLFSGWIIDRLGARRVLYAGALCLGLCLAVALVSQHLLHYWGALLLLGLGWNLLFVAGTVLLGQCYRPAERFRAQAANDVVIFGAQALASLAAGALLFSVGWAALNIVGVLLLLAMIGALLWLRWRMAQAQRDAAVLQRLLEIGES